jgi:hypothetical protein
MIAIIRKVLKKFSKRAELVEKASADEEAVTNLNILLFPNIQLSKAALAKAQSQEEIIISKIEQARVAEEVRIIQSPSLSLDLRFSSLI